MTPKRFVDILNSHSDSTRYYTGIAGNVRRRLEEHNAGGCRHTHRWRPWRVVVVIAFASEQRALDFERYLKTGPGHTIAHNAVAFFHDGITISTHGIPVPTASTGRWRSTSAGVKIPNVNGGFAGRAPDLGAYERGQPLPVYGPRGSTGTRPFYW